MFLIQIALISRMDVSWVDIYQVACRMHIFVVCIKKSFQLRVLQIVGCKKNSSGPINYSYWTVVQIFGIEKNVLCRLGHIVCMSAEHRMIMILLFFHNAGFFIEIYEVKVERF